MKNDPPFIFNMAALAIIPISAATAKTATAQIDAIYNVADDPNTPVDQATALAKLAGRLMQRLMDKK